MIDRIFKKVNGENGKTFLREGKEGTGLRLPYHCGFCKEGDEIKFAFRTQRERNSHAQRCLE